MPRYPEEAKQQVRDAVDFTDLVGAHTELRRAGPGRLEGLCPFHQERTPSLKIDPAQKLYHCFGCGAGGDLFTFVQETEGLDFPAAMEYLADRYGVHLAPGAQDPGATERRKQTERLRELLDRTASFYEHHLWQSPEAALAREYLTARGLQEAALRAYRVGYSPSRLDAMLNASRQAGFTGRECDAAGLTRRSASGPPVECFRGRIMFPLTDRRGRVIGFAARALGADQEPKYLNSSDSTLFSKGRNLYGTHLARAAALKAGTVVLCEGYTDVIALHQAGLQNVVGSMGTAVTEHQVTELARLARRVTLAFDADAAGQEALLRAAKAAAGYTLEVGVVRLPAGQDPADVAAAEGREAIRGLVEASVPFATFRMERELARGGRATAATRGRVLDALRGVLAELPSGAQREQFIREVTHATTTPSLDAHPAPGAELPDSTPGSPVLCDRRPIALRADESAGLEL